MSKELIRELQNLQIQEDTVVLQLTQISSKRKELLRGYSQAKNSENKQAPPAEQTLRLKIGGKVLYSNTGKTQVFDKTGQVTAIGRVFITVTTDSGAKVRRQVQNLRLDSEA